MGLKFKIAKLEDVAEGVRNLYKQQADGSYLLDVEGAVERERLEEFRNNNIALQQQIDKFKGVDPTKYAELMEIQRKLQEKELIEKGDIDKLVELRVGTMRESLTAEAATLKTELQKANGQLSSLLVDNVVKSAAIKLGVHPTAVDDVVLRAKTVFVVENGAPVPKDADGKIIYGKDAAKPMSVDDWTAGLKTTAPHLFQGSQGSGATGGTGSGSVDMSKLSPAQKIAMGLAGGAGAIPAELPR